MGKALNLLLRTTGYAPCLLLANVFNALLGWEEADQEATGRELAALDTTAPAATMDPSPIFAPFKTIALMPTRQPSPIWQPCKIALCPTTQSSPTTA